MQGSLDGRMRCFALSLVVFWSLYRCTLTVADGPMEPLDALQAFQVHPGLNVQLVASEPDVLDPVQIAFDPLGRLWVVEMSDYPNGPNADQPGLSQIRVLTDQDGDGQYSHSVLFANQLLFATGLMFWKDGLIVTTDGKIQFMRDRNGDGECDEIQVWFQGFATENPQLRHNRPQLALDGYIYVANGLRGGNIVPGTDNPWGLNPDTKPLSIAGRDFRFDPRTGKYDAVAGVAQFGMTFLHGDRFVCTNRNPARQVVLENDQLTLTPGLRAVRHFEDVGPAGDQSVLYPISTTWTTSILHANQFTAACGLLAFPEVGLGDRYTGALFTCDPTANLVHCTQIVPAGPTYRALPNSERTEFLASTDEWFRPVNLTLGPDGGLYIVDMCRAVIEHPQFMPEELKNRPDLLLGRDRGRIWRVMREGERRVSSQDSFIPEHPDLDTLLNALIVDVRRPENSIWKRAHAFRLMIEAGDPRTPQQLRTLRESHSFDTETSLAILEAFDSVTLDDLKWTMSVNPSAGLTSQVARIGAEKFGDSKEWLALVNEHFAQLLSEFPSRSQSNELGQLRKQLFVGLGRVAWTQITPSNRKELLMILLSSNHDEVDPEWIATYLGVSAREQAAIVLADLLKVCSELKEPSRCLAITSSMAALTARQSSDREVLKVLQTTVGSGTIPIEHQMAVVAGCSQGYSHGIQRLRALLQQQTFQDQIGVFELCDVAAYQLQHRDVTDELFPILTTLLGLADGPESLKQLVEMTASGDEQRASLALAAMMNRPPVDLHPALIKMLPQRRGRIRREILVQFAGSSGLVPKLLDEIESGRVALTEIDESLERTLMRVRAPDQLARAKRLLHREPPADRVQVLADYQHCLELEADPRRGERIFEQHCASCHRVGAIGISVAPDISDSYSKTPDYFLMSILDPNRAIDANYFSYTVVETSGRVHTGILAAETSAEIVLKQPDGKTVTIPQDEIEMFKNDGVSLMPVGLERSINPQQMADLISFLKNWRYLDGQVPPAVIKPSSR